MEQKPMKTKHLSNSRNASKTTQSKILRTKSVRKRPAGRQPKRAVTLAPQAIHPDLQLSLDFGEAILASAIMLSDRLHQLNGDASTRVIRETLRLAQANFEALRSRVSGFQQGGGV
jgi:hypothetical protein